MKLIDYIQGLDAVPDERTARGLIMRGDVLVDGRPVTSPHAAVPPGAEVRLREQCAVAVSRGELKLGPVLAQCGFAVSGLVCADLGASTGGFTRVLLDHGAARVYAVDVGYGILDLSLRNDSRVVVLERTNARTLDTVAIPEPLARVVGDLSFISWRPVIPAVTRLIEPAAELLLLVKPQFELAALGRGDELADGVVVAPDLARQALEQLYGVWADNGLIARGIHPSPVRGAKGNLEYFVHLVDNKEATGFTREAYVELINRAIEGRVG